MAGSVFEDLPEHIIENILIQLPLSDLEACKVLNKYFHDLVTTNIQLLLYQELESSSQIIPPSIRQSNNAASLLSLVRERQSGFRTIAPSRTFRVDLDPDERRLYEYIEGTLLRGNGRYASSSRLPAGATLYDLTASSEWETIDAYTPSFGLSEAKEFEEESHDRDEEEEVVIIAEGSDDKEHYKRRRWEANFELKDFTIDPGQDLCIAAEITPMTHTGGRSELSLHVLSLSEFEPHPKACTIGGIKGVMKNLTTWHSNSISLTLQICDDKVFVFSNNIGQTNLPEAKLMAWNWQTGQLLFIQRSECTLRGREMTLVTIEDFVLLSPTTFGVIQFVVSHPRAEHFSCHLNVHTLVRNTTTWEDGGAGAKDSIYEPIKIAVFELPRWLAVIMIHMRSDPPPRQFFPTENPLKVYPRPDTGILVITFDCDDGPAAEDGEAPCYHLFVRKETLLSFLPIDGFKRHDRQTLEGFQPKSITWEELAPHCRFVEDLDRQDWVCYVYHYRFVSPRTELRLSSTTNHEISETYIRLFNFDPNEINRVMRARRRSLEDGKRAWIDWENAEQDENVAQTGDINKDHALQGMDDRNVYLVTNESFIEAEGWLAMDVRTGGKMPYIWLETTNPRRCNGLMVDDSRIIALTQDDDPDEPNDPRRKSYLEVLHMGP